MISEQELKNLCKKCFYQVFEFDGSNGAIQKLSDDREISAVANLIEFDGKQPKVQTQFYCPFPDKPSSPEDIKHSLDRLASARDKHRNFNAMNYSFALYGDSEGAEYVSGEINVPEINSLEKILNNLSSCLDKKENE